MALQLQLPLSNIQASLQSPRRADPQRNALIKAQEEAGQINKQRRKEKEKWQNPK